MSLLERKYDIHYSISRFLYALVDYSDLFERRGQ